MMFQKIYKKENLLKVNGWEKRIYYITLISIKVECKANTTTGKMEPKVTMRI